MGISLARFNTPQQQTAKAVNGYSITATDEANNTVAGIDRQGNVLGNNQTISSEAIQGDNSAYTVTTSQLLGNSYYDNLTISIKPDKASTGAPTLNINSIGAVPLLTQGGSVASLKVGIWQKFTYTTGTDSSGKATANFIQSNGGSDEVKGGAVAQLTNQKYYDACADDKYVYGIYCDSSGNGCIDVFDILNSFELKSTYTIISDTSSAMYLLCDSNSLWAVFSSSNDITYLYEISKLDFSILWSIALGTLAVANIVQDDNNLYSDVSVIKKSSHVTLHTFSETAVRTICIDNDNIYFTYYSSGSVKIFKKSDYSSTIFSTLLDVVEFLDVDDTNIYCANYSNFYCYDLNWNLKTTYDNHKLSYGNYYNFTFIVHDSSTYIVGSANRINAYKKSDCSYSWSPEGWYWNASARVCNNYLLLNSGKAGSSWKGIIVLKI